MQSISDDNENDPIVLESEDVVLSPEQWKAFCKALDARSKDTPVLRRPFREGIFTDAPPAPLNPGRRTVIEKP